MNFGLLTPKYLANIIKLNESGKINRATAITMIGWYINCDESVREK